MSAQTIAAAPRPSRVLALWNSHVGKKALMAVSGIVLFLYVLGHMLGNLQVFAGSEALDEYARLLRRSLPLLWAVRVVLLAAFLVHAVAGIQLWLGRRRARPIGYERWRPAGSTVASRTMIWSGFLILGFLAYHLLDLTFGVVNPDFREGEVFHNVLVSLGRGAAGVAYLVAMIALGFHLWHGLWSMFQSLGLASRGVSISIQRFAVAFAVVLTLGFSAIPLAVLTGLVAP